MELLYVMPVWNRSLRLLGYATQGVRWLPVVRARWAELAAAGFHVGVSEDEWRHEHVPDNYVAVSGAEDMERAADFLKLSAAVGLDRWEDAPEQLLRMFKTLISVLF